MIIIFPSVCIYTVESKGDPLMSPARLEQVDKLYLEYRSWLSVLIQKRLGCPHSTADLVQDTYLRLLASGKLPAAKDSRRYLTHIAKGLVIDLYRRRRIESAYLEYLQQRPVDVYPSPEIQLQTVEALIEVDALLHRLPIKVRQALLLRQLEGLSYRDIAQRLQVSVSSVEKYIARALQGIMLAAQGEKH